MTVVIVAFVVFAVVVAVGRGIRSAKGEKLPPAPPTSNS